VHPAVFATFDRLCVTHRADGAILEIGATATADTLLNLPALSHARERIGVNVAGDGQASGYRIVQANANDLRMFPDARFDTILCNATLEHDPRFWLTLAETRRLLKPGGLVVIGVPGYVRRSGWAHRVMTPACWIWRRPLPGASALEAWAAATPTLLVHHAPGDFYRFSEQAMRVILLEDFQVMDVVTVLSPPRIVGVGRKRAG
jgi:SAM-dependent methyltransferase